MISRYRGIMVVLGAIGIVSIASQLRLLNAPDGWAYDLAVRLGGWGTSGAPRVLMVEADSQEPLTVADASSVLDSVQKLGADHVIFLALPRGIGDDFYRKAREYGNVFVGDPAAAVSVQTGPPALPTGSLVLPPAEFGIHRRAGTIAMADGQEGPTLALLSTRYSNKQPAAGEFLVNFNAGPDWIPRVSAARVLAEGLIPELVAGRVVVIGRSLLPTEAGFYTPINTGAAGMSMLEFQSYAINTLLQDQQIRTAPWWWNLLMFGSIGLISLMVYQWFNLDRSSWFSLFLVVGYLGLGWLLLHIFLLWIPVVEMIIAQVLMFWLFVRFKILKEDQEMRDTVLKRMARLQEYVLPADFYDLDEHWGRVITFLDQTLNLNRVILLERVEGDHRVREVQALRCSLEDIDERRRDFERAPYSDSIAEGGPIKLERRLFFSRPTGSTYDQYMVPLLFGGEVQGFWAFDVDTTVVESTDGFLANIRDFAGRIAELLYHRHRRMKQHDAEKKILQRFFRLEVAKGSSQEIGELLELLDHRLIALQAVFDGLATAAIHYDLFGRVVQLNSSMEEFMRQQDLPGYDLTALDFLVAMTGMPPDQVRRLLRQVIVERLDFLVPVATNGGAGTSHSIHVKSLAAPEADSMTDSSTAPFELAGILFELSDESGAKKRIEIREQLLEWMSLKTRNELSSFVDFDSCGHCESANRVNVKVAKVLGILDQTHAALSAASVNSSSSVCPVDAYPLLFSVIEETAGALAGKKVGCNADVPRLMSLISVQPEQLKLLFKTILEVLASDAAADSALEIQATEQDESLCFTFRNTGFGIPDEHLQAHLQEPEYGVTEEFKGLREAMQPVAGWGGEVEIHSEVGVGMSARLRLAVAT